MIKVHLVPIISQMQNYAYILEADNGEVGVVDPGEAAPIIRALEERNLKPDVILITHHHWDHMNGTADMLAWHECPVVGSDASKSAPDSPAKTKVSVAFERILEEGDEFSFGGESVQIFDTPGHTPEHICFYFPESGFALVGDVLFSLGCGRVLDGTAQELYNSVQKLNALPDDTLIYCGHEYTLSNAAFCLAQEPENEDLKARYEEVKVLREDNMPTIPARLESERKYNVFLRAQNAEEFAKLRALKDRF
ncbi:MAG: hydroxyacylglutathione hydrolase [Pseudomonadota bacterium]